MAGIGEKLRERALILGLSDVEIARRVGLSQSRYANYVLGKREPDFGTLVKICRVLGTTPNFLLGFGDEAEAPSEAALIRKEIHRATLSMDVPMLLTARTVVVALADSAKRGAGDPETSELERYKANNLKMLRGIILSESTLPLGSVYRDIPRHALHPVLFRLWQNYERSTPDESVMIADSAFYAWQGTLFEYRERDGGAFEGERLDDAAGYWRLEWKAGPLPPQGAITLMLERGGRCAEIDPSAARVTAGTWCVYNNRLLSISTQRDGEEFKTMIVAGKSRQTGEVQGFAVTFPVSLLTDSACDFMSEGVSCFSAHHSRELIGDDAGATSELLRASGHLQQWGVSPDYRAR